MELLGITPYGYLFFIVDTNDTGEYYFVQYVQKENRVPQKIEKISISSSMN